MATPPSPLTQDPYRLPTTPRTHESSTRSTTHKVKPGGTPPRRSYGTVNSAGLGEGNAVGVVSSRDESPRRHKPGVPTRPVGGGPREASIPVGPIQIRSTPARASKSEGGFSSPGNLACTSHGPTLIRTQRRPSHSRRGPGGAASSAAKRRQPQPLIRRAGRSHLREYRLAGVEPRTAGMSAHLIPYRVARRGTAHPLSQDVSALSTPTR